MNVLSRPYEQLNSMLRYPITMKLILPLTTLLLLSVGRVEVGGTNLPISIPDKVAAGVEPFDLGNVHLLPGAFKNAQDLNHTMLLKVDTNLLLYPYRREAGIPSPVKGNDSLSYKWTGHTLGHYLSACALLYRNTGDPKIKAKADAVVAALAKVQEKMGDGYLGGMPEKSVLELEGLVKDPKVHADVPWYVLHKLYAGLFDMYLLTGNQQALDVLKNAVDWAEKNIAQLDDQQMETMLRKEHGGIKEVLLNLYAVTGREDYLKLAERFTHHAVLDPLLQGKDPLDGLHANTQIPKFIGVARQYELTGDRGMRNAAESFWNIVTCERSYVTGGNSSAEHFTPKAQLSTAFFHTIESCNEYNMLKLTRHLFCLNPSVRYADYYERTLFNQVLSTRNPQNGDQLYFQLLQSGSSKELWRTNPIVGADSCCHGTGLESNSKYEDSIYFHKGEDQLYINLFIASVLDWKAKGLNLRQETSFPDQETSKLYFSCAQPHKLTIKIRRPWWAAGNFELLVNGKKQQIESSPGSYAVVDRTWQNGDCIEVKMPMSFRFEGFKDDPKRVAVMYGPLVMAAVTQPGNLFSEIHAQGHDPLETLKPIEGKPLEFTAPSNVFRTSPSPSEKQEIHFKPLLRMVDESYAVYWDIKTP